MSIYFLHYKISLLTVPLSSLLFTWDLTVILDSLTSNAIMPFIHQSFQFLLNWGFQELLYQCFSRKEFFSCFVSMSYFDFIRWLTWMLESLYINFRERCMVIISINKEIESIIKGILPPFHNLFDGISFWMWNFYGTNCSGNCVL